MTNVAGRRGLPSGVVMSYNAYAQTKAASATGPHNTNHRLDCEIGSYALPHPYKSHDNVSSSRRQYSFGKELNNDLSLCEDAHFTMVVPGSGGEDSSQIYICVADGVGGWRSRGVDPREFAHALCRNAKTAIELNAEIRADADVGAMLGLGSNAAIHPLDVIIEAWNATTYEEVNGSSCICVATLDNELNQLSYSNLGDCGLVVIRHIDSAISGYMRNREKPRHERKNDLRIAYLSQQQIKSFNMPYQLGYCNLNDDLGLWVGDTPQVSE